MKSNDVIIQDEVSQEVMLQQFDLIKLLNKALTQEQFEARILAMIPNGYRMLCVFLNQQCVGVSGYWINTKIYSGKYLEPDNVVVHPEHRSEGIGKLMSDRLQQIALDNGCEIMMLDAYIPNLPAHRFYEREGYVKKGYHFLKHLSEKNH